MERDTPRPSPAPVAAHLARCFFHLSENWIYTQTAHLERYDPFVLTWTTQNLSSVERPLPRYALYERPHLEQFLNRVGRRVLGYYPAFYWQLKRRGARVLHAHFGLEGHYALALAHAAGVPLVTTFYGYDLSLLPATQPEWKRRYAKLFAEGARFLVEGSHMRRQLVALGCPPPKVRVQHLGIRVDDFPYRPRPRRAGAPLRVLAAGRFSEKKGFVYAIEAFARFLASGGRGTLTFIGDAKSEDEAQQHTKRALLDAVQQHDLAAHVTFRGLQPHRALIGAYYDHHVFLSPSVHASDGDNEGGAPVTLIEASATGLPVVSTTHCDIPEVVRHEVTGLLAPERDAEALARHLFTLFERPALAEEMGRRAHEHIAAEYDARQQGQALERVYDEVRADHARQS